VSHLIGIYNILQQIDTHSFPEPCFHAHRHNFLFTALSLKGPDWIGLDLERMMRGIHRKGMMPGLLALLQLMLYGGQAIPLDSDQSLPWEAGVSQHLPLPLDTLATIRRAAPTPTLNQSLPQQAIPLNISDDGTSCPPLGLWALLPVHARLLPSFLLFFFFFFN
jgi:hypothetical protein